MSKKLKIITILLISILLIGITIDYIFHGRERDLATEQIEFSVKAKEITAEFGSNVTLATKKYADKAIAISGKVTAVTDSTVTIDQSIICNFIAPDTTIKNNQIIAVKGRLVGFDDLMGELKLDQCSINKNN
jgi:hypothetical protein